MSTSARRLWWLNPAWLFAIVISLTMLASIMLSDHAYLKYGTNKYVGTKHLLIAAAAIMAFAFGERLSAIMRAPKPTPPGARRVIRFWFWLTFSLSLFGYLVWAGIGVKNGVSLSMVGELIADENTYMAEERVRKELFPTIPGVTTCAQFGMASFLLGLWLFAQGEKKIIWPLAVILFFSLVRALLWRERTALLALAAPAFIFWMRVYVLNRPLKPLTTAALQLGPIFGIIALFVVFGGFEYFRSWRIYKHDFSSYAEFTVWRLGGYFTTAHNNGAMAVETQPPLPMPFWTLRPWWEFPGMAKSSISYYRLTGVDPATAHEDMLMRYGTIEYNNEGGLFSPYVDYGWLGFLVFWSLCGLISGRLYRGYLLGTAGGLLLYPIIFLVTLKTPLILFFVFPAAFPPIATLFVVAWRAASVRPSRMAVAARWPEELNTLLVSPHPAEEYRHG